MKKKLITALALSVALTFSFAACGSSDTNVESSNSSVNNEISSDTSTGEEQPDEVTENGEADKSNDAAYLIPERVNITIIRIKYNIL